VKHFEEKLIMKYSYPIVLTKSESGFSVYIPDFEANTQGENAENAVYMAEDAIMLLCTDFAESGKEIPHPSKISDIKIEINQKIAFADIDFDEHIGQSQFVRNFEF
jgi:predicted RNase H-like HicB family nuclease